MSSNKKNISPEKYDTFQKDNTLIVKKYDSSKVDSWFLIQSLNKLKSTPHINSIEKVIDYEINSTECEVLVKKIKGNTLDYLIKKNNKIQVNVLLKIAKTLSHIHTYGCYHGSVMPQNIILDYNNNPILTNFGSIQIGENLFYSHEGNLAFFAPEIFKIEGFNWSEEEAQSWDVYSFGVTAYWLLNSGSLPPVLDQLNNHNKHFLNDELLFEKFTNELDKIYNYKFQLLNKEEVVDNESINNLYSIINKCLYHNPKNRYKNMVEVENLLVKLPYKNIRIGNKNKKFKISKSNKNNILTRFFITLFGGVSIILLFLIFQISDLYISLKDEMLKENILKNKYLSYYKKSLAQRNNLTDVFSKKIISHDDAKSIFTSVNKVSLDKEQIKKTKKQLIKLIEDLNKHNIQSLTLSKSYYSLAVLENKLNNKSEVIKNLDKSIKELKKKSPINGNNNNELRKYDIYLIFTNCYEKYASIIENNDCEKSIFYWKESIKYLESLMKLNSNDESIKLRHSKNCYKLAELLKKNNQYDESIKFFLKSESGLLNSASNSIKNYNNYFNEIGDLKYKIASTLKLSKKYLDSQNTYKSAYKIFLEIKNHPSFKITATIRAIKCNLEIIEILSNNLSKNQSEIKRLYNESLRILSPLKDTNSKNIDFAIIASQVLVGIGELDKDNLKWSKADSSYIEGIELLDKAIKQNSNTNFKANYILSILRLKYSKFLKKPYHIKNISKKGFGNLNKSYDLFLISKSKTNIKWKLKYKKLYKNYGNFFQSISESKLSEKSFDKYINI